MTTALEKTEQTGRGIETSTAQERRLASLRKQCATLAKSDLVPKAVQGNVDNVFALALYGERYGLSPIHAVQRIYLVEGQFVEKAEVLGGVLMRAGHELRWDETSADRCTVSIRRRGDDGWQSTTWTIDDARRAGLLDMWVEQWRKVVQDGERTRNVKDVIVVGDDGGVFTEEERKRRALPPIPAWAQTKLDAGEVKRRDVWHQYPGDMLAAKALRRAAKRIVGDALLGFDVDDDAYESVVPERVAARHERDDEQMAGDAGLVAETDIDLDPEPDDDGDGGEPAARPEPDGHDDDETIVDAEIIDEPPAHDDDEQTDEQLGHVALKRLMATCSKAFPETDAPRGEKTRRQRILRRAAQYAVVGEHKPADELTVDELENVEKWVFRSFLDASAVTRKTFEIRDDGSVAFCLNDRVKIVPPIPAGHASGEAA